MVPHCVAYKVNTFTGLVFKFLRKLPFINLVNIILDKEVVPEFLQSRCHPLLLANCIEDLLENNFLQRTQITAFEAVLASLAPKKNIPSQIAAEVILNTIKKLD